MLGLISHLTMPRKLSRIQEIHFFFIPFVLQGKIMDTQIKKVL